MATYELRPADFRRFQLNLEATYLIRLFAEFESALRDAWKSVGRDTQSRTFDLLDALASRSRVPEDVRREAHRVREYRNGFGS